MANNRISLKPESAAYLCRRYDLQPHPLLRVGQVPFEASEDERTKAADIGRQQLKQQGLIDTDDVHPFLEDAWNLLAHPPLAVGLAVRSQQGTDFNAVLVEQGRSTLEAYQADGETSEEITDIIIGRHEYGGLAGNAVNLLGQIKPGQGGSASLPSEILDTASKRMAANPSGSAHTALASSGVRQADAQVLTKVLSARPELEAVLTFRAFDSKVRRMHQLPFSLHFFATTDGSYVSQKKPGGDGREWYTVAPADSRKFSAKIDEMTRALTQPARR